MDFKPFSINNMHPGHSTIPSGGAQLHVVPCVFSLKAKRNTWKMATIECGSFVENGSTNIAASVSEKTMRTDSFVWTDDEVKLLSVAVDIYKYMALVHLSRRSHCAVSMRRHRLSCLIRA